jgi:hypothetical protein
MNCPNCGTSEPGPGAFCMRCGARLPALAEAAVIAGPAPAAPPPPVQPAVIPPAPAAAAVQRSDPAPSGGERTIRHISAGSVFKVTFVTYALLIAIFGCLLVLLPGLLGSSLLGGILGDQLGGQYALGALGGGIVGTLVLYVMLIVLGAFGPALSMAIAALLYNLVASWVGGVRVELRG